MIRKILRFCELFFGLIAYWATFRLRPKSSQLKIDHDSRHLILIDGYLVASACREISQSDPYFGQFDQYCDEVRPSGVTRKRTLVHFLYTPTPVNPFTAGRASTIIKKRRSLASCNISCIFEHLSFGDMALVLLSPLFYSFSSKFLGLPNHGIANMAGDSAQNWSLLEQIKSAAVRRFINQSSLSTISVFSWYENQNLQRILFQTLRSFQDIESTITGCAFYIPYGDLDALMPSLQDWERGAAPDRVAYLCKEPMRTRGVKYVKGLATRQARVFSSPYFYRLNSSTKNALVARN